MRLSVVAWPRYARSSDGTEADWSEMALGDPIDARNEQTN
jgi:hypothetical protein